MTNYSFWGRYCILLGFNACNIWLHFVVNTEDRRGCLKSQDLGKKFSGYKLIAYKHVATKEQRHLTIDCLGLVMCVLVTAVSLPEREGGQVLKQVKAMIPERTNRLFLVWADGGYSGNSFLRWVMDSLHSLKPLQKNTIP